MELWMEIEQFLIEVELGRKEIATHGEPTISEIEHITEHPKIRYKPKIGWYRKCHRCPAGQRSSSQYAFEPMHHICMRDSTLKSVIWCKHPRWS